jgi:hypothetical protein
MFWMGAYTLRREVGGGWALEFPSFLGPVKWERADRRVSFHLDKFYIFFLLLSHTNTIKETLQYNALAVKEYLLFFFNKAYWIY